MAYINETEVDNTKPKGDYWNPMFLDEKPEKKLLATYFGFTVKWDRDLDSKWSVEENKTIFTYYAVPVYKKSRNTFYFINDSWDDIMDLLFLMKERGHLTNEITEALLSLDINKTYQAALDKLSTL